MTTQAETTRIFDDEFLNDLATRFAQTRDRARVLVESLSQEQLHQSPQDGVWSVADCIEHLCVAGRGYVKKIDPVLTGAVINGRARKRGSFSPGPISRWFINAVGPNSTRTFRVPRHFEVCVDPEKDAWLVMAEFDTVGQSLRVCLHRSKFLDLNRLIVQSPAVSWLRLPAGSMLLALAAHEERHMDQAEAVAQALV